MDTSLYRRVWRWHFYAGLIVLPVLVWLAVTGGLYLYKPEIERAFYHDWVVLPAPASPQPLAATIRRVEAEAGGIVRQIARPAGPRESWRMTVERPDGVRRTAFVDPASGHVLGTTADGGVMKVVRDLHSLVIAGPVGNAVIEIVAGWTIILVVTGILLWWPSGGRKGLALRGVPAGRLFWRDLHASTGALVGAVILFLAVTGMPWSFFWGATVQRLVTAQGLGRPAPPNTDRGAASRHHQDADPRRETHPWALHQAAAPVAGGGGGDVGPDRVAAVAAARGLRPPYTLNLPSSPGSPYSISRTPARADEARLLYVDPAHGHVLGDTSYRDFGAGAKAIEWGIYTHQGQQYGEPNRLLMLAGCLGVLLLAATAPILWWKRRRRGRLEAPPRPRGEGNRRILAPMLLIGMVYPLTGLTMVAALAVELAIRKRRQAG
ncbi:PepSY-associated TM helix domain-containing protein [Allosphingosinicella deserti]|uniref:PepSY domain-containing protein n=1 Tax=Allosphingosinicella deserti TaxID=2116704 RepID=A0A2P7QN47_9SPHN|nr:PepSY domain-containing protein [Sphingomonas deserti]PSJ39385.1 PepSY domain-containing protein [Sphingomonas deserti]